jgi:hypothetical protein
MLHPHPSARQFAIESGGGERGEKIKALKDKRLRNDEAGGTGSAKWACSHKPRTICHQSP